MNLTHSLKKASKELEQKTKLIEKAVMVAFEKEAHETQKDFVLNTPRGYTGNTRKAWTVKNLSKGKTIHFRIFNPSPVMGFLEEGTKTRRPRRSKHLFIPQRHSAWRKGGYRAGMVYGRDFIFSRRAKGIKAIKIVPKQITKTKARLKRRLLTRLQRI
jgi:hypothetical protein